MQNNYPYNPYQSQPVYRQPQYMDTMASQQPNQFMGIKGCPVSSFEEVRAMRIDFDGSVFYFPDLANQRIYTKQVNMDGTATLNVYELTKLPDPQLQAQSYITRDEFNTVIEQLKQSFAGFVAPIVQQSQQQAAGQATVSQPITQQAVPAQGDQQNAQPQAPQKF